MALSAYWQSFMDFLDTQLLKADADEVNKVVIQISEEVATKTASGQLLHGEAMEVKDNLMLGLRTAIMQFAVLTQGYVCKTLEALQHVTLDDSLQTVYTANNASSLMRHILEGGPSYSIVKSCSDRAIFISSSGFSAMAKYPDVDGRDFITHTEAAISASMGRYAASLFKSEDDTISTSVSEHHIRHRIVEDLVSVQLLVPVPENVRSSTSFKNSSIEFPMALLATLGHNVTGPFQVEKTASIHLQAQGHVPLVPGVTVRSYLFGATLYEPDGSLIPVSD
eukprot:1735676-Rhodomonas_salina.1